MQAGVFISALSHVVLVALALLGTPKLFDDPVMRAIEVDLVRPDEVETPREPEKPQSDKQAAWDPLPDNAEPWPDTAPAAQSQSPKPSQQAALPAQPQRPSPGPAQPQPTEPSIFDPVNIPALLNLPNAPDKGFDAEATTLADLSGDDKAAFKLRVKKCWKLPDGLSPAPATRVVLRVYLKRDGALASEPVLVEASATRDGPVVMQTAIRALKECQPYGFLPADKYREWRVLDLSFTPRDMAGG